MDDYFTKKEYLDCTLLKKYRQSPLHYITALTEEVEETPALKFGRLYHTAILEPDKFKEYKILNLDERPEPAKGITSKLNQEWKKAFLANNKTIEPKDLKKINDMKKQIQAKTVVGQILTGGEAEKSIYVDNFEGLKFKIRPDYVRSKSIIDLKTTTSANPTTFVSDAYKLGYHIQAALYVDVMKQMDGVERQFIFIVQEKESPYAVTLFRASDEFLDAGRVTYKSLIQIHKNCVKEQKWPGYEIYGYESELGIVDLTVPSWMGNSNEYFLKVENDKTN